MSDRSAARTYRRDTDSEGIVVEYRPLRDVRPGDEIAGGWRPWAKVERVETGVDVESDAGMGRVYYTTHGPTDWFSLDSAFPVVVEDPGA